MTAEWESEPGGAGWFSSVPGKVWTVIVAALVVGAGGAAYLAFGRDDSFPPVAYVPTLQPGWNWWYASQYKAIDYEDDEEYEGETYRYISIYNQTTLNGTEVYTYYSVSVNHTTTRQDIYSRYMSTDQLNGIYSDGTERDAILRFPLKDGKTWNWTDYYGDERLYEVNVAREVSTSAGTFDTFRIREIYTSTSTSTNITTEYDNNYYYAPDASYFVKITRNYDRYDGENLTRSHTSTQSLFLMGRTDSDHDRISDSGELWLGTDPQRRDTDGDGIDDLQDRVPLFDYGIAVNLTYFRTDEDVEDTEDTLAGEEEGADVTFEFSNDITNEVLTTAPVQNQDETVLDVQYVVDIPDNTTRWSFNVEVYSYDTDNWPSENDDFDISEDDFIYRLSLYFVIYYKTVWIYFDFENPIEMGVEQESQGNGAGDYDATLRWIVAEVDMAEAG